MVQEKTNWIAVAKRTCVYAGVNPITNVYYLISKLKHITKLQQYSAILGKNLYYTPWKQSTTVVLHKPGKPHYDSSKAYGPIVLLNTMSKVLTAIVANLMTYYTEKHKLLPAHHFGRHPGRTTSDAVHLLVYKVKDAWHKHHVKLFPVSTHGTGTPWCNTGCSGPRGLLTLK